MNQKWPSREKTKRSYPLIFKRGIIKMKKEKKIKKSTLRCTLSKNFTEIDLREIPFKKRIIFILGLLLNQKIRVCGGRTYYILKDEKRKNIK